MKITMTLRDGVVYTLDGEGRVLDRTDGPKGWDYSGKWIILGFARHWNSSHYVSLAGALAGADTGAGYVVDNDHGTIRRWGGPDDHRLLSLRVTQ